MISKIDWFWILLATIFSALPLVSLGKFIESGEEQLNWVITAIVAQILVVIIYMILLKNKQASIIYPLIKIMSIILVAVTGVLYLEENISTQQVVGIIVGIASMIIISTC